MMLLFDVELGDVRRSLRRAKKNGADGHAPKLFYL